jgi:WD40 repeat protein
VILYKASFSPSGSYVICGSEDRGVFLWETNPTTSSIRIDRNDVWELVKVKAEIGPGSS